MYCDIIINVDAVGDCIHPTVTPTFNQIVTSTGPSFMERTYDVVAQVAFRESAP